MKTLDTSRTYGEVVAITVDVQNDFCPGGSLGVDGGNEVVEPMNQLNRWVRKAGGFVVATRDKHPAVTSHFDTWPAHCVVNTWGSAFHPDLELEAFDAVASKGMGPDEDGYSGYDAIIEPTHSKFGSLVENRPEAERTLGAALEEIVNVNRYLGARTLILFGGLAGDFCVPATGEPILKLDHEWVDAVWIEDAVRSVNQENGEKAKQALIDAGMYAMSVDDIINGGVVIDRSRLER